MAITEPNQLRSVRWRGVVDHVVDLRTAIMRVFDDNAYLGTVRQGEDFDILVSQVHNVMPADVSHDAVYRSMTHMAGMVINQTMVFMLAARLAGNIDKLKCRVAVQEWRPLRVGEWVPVQIIGAKRRRAAKQRNFGYAFEFHVFGGSPSGMTINKFWSDKFSRFIATEMGFRTRPVSPKSQSPVTRLYQHPTELVSMRCMILVHPELSSAANGPGFRHVSVPAGMVDHNRNLMKYRDRIGDDYRCPVNNPPSVPCFRCPKGYSTCQAGCHRYDYVFKTCEVCHAANAAHDQALSLVACINCYNKAAVTN